MGEGEIIGIIEKILKQNPSLIREKGSYKSAAEVYMALVKGGVTAYEEGADDSDGYLGDSA